MSEQQKGLIYAITTYIIWGFFPLFWKLLEQVNSIEILLSRIIWSFVFTTLFIFLIGQRKTLFQDIKSLWIEKRSFWSLMAASFVISCNWYIYIWAVNHDHVIDTSLGYYINPIITVLCGMIFFKEKLSRAQIAAVVFAFIGVGIMTVSYGKIPWISLLLAFTFATYGVLKKKVPLNETRGLAIETMFVLPIALVYYIYLMSTSETSFMKVDLKLDLLLMVGGVLTAFPLILFAKGAKRLPQSILGFIQYLSPTLILFLGIVLYREPFTKIDLLSFSFIWVGILIFTISTFVESRKRHHSKGQLSI